VVVWVFSGGGEAEVRGLIPFLEKNFPGCRFERKLPVKNKGPKPNKANSYGKTGQSLIDQISNELPIALRNEPNKCNLILIFDDLDCRSPREQREKILTAISKISASSTIEKFVGFAAPEIESWIIADWSNSIGQHPDFKSKHEHMRWWLSTQKGVSFDSPESFSEYDRERNCCREKLSEILIESSVLDIFDSSSKRFRKGSHTPDLLKDIRPNIIQKSCPLFRELYNYLNQLCQNNNI